MDKEAILANFTGGLYQYLSIKFCHYSHFKLLYLEKKLSLTPSRNLRGETWCTPSGQFFNFFFTTWAIEVKLCSSE